MKWMLQSINKGKRIGWQRSERKCYLGIACFRSLVFPLCFFSMAVLPLVFIEAAASHPGVAPEIDEITHKIENNPNNVDFLIKRGELYRSNKDHIKSLSDFERAGQLESGNPEIFFQRGLTLAALGRDVDAEVDLGKFLESENLKGNGSNNSSGKNVSKNAIALAERAQIRAKMGKSELALADFNSATQILPVVGVYQARGDFLESEGKLAEAASGYREGLARLPHAILLKESLIRVEIARNHFNQALALIDEELVRAPIKTEGYLRRAEVLSAMGNAEAAGVAREQALAAVNQTMKKRVTAMHRFSRAKVYVALGRLKEAKDDLRLAIKMAPNFTGTRDLLGKLEGN